MPSIKHRILVGLARRGGKVANPKALRLDANADVHAVVHVLWRLQKQGLVTFTETKSGPMTVPTKITITDKGRHLVRRHINGR